MIDILLDVLIDSLKMLPFLFGAYLLIEYIEHRAAKKFVDLLTRFGRAGSVAGAALGCVPQCGFSVAAANLFSNRLITAGTLIAVFISTSDEAIPILLASPESASKILPLLVAKIIIAIVAGLIIDLTGILKTPKEELEEVAEEHSHCHTEGHGGIILSALRHTGEVFLFLVVVMLLLNLAISFVGEEALAGLLMEGSFLQPILATLVGAIPNCAASVIIASLYAEGTLSFGSAVAGLSAGAGLGLVVLFRTNHSKKESFIILGILLGVSIISGVLLQLIM